MLLKFEKGYSSSICVALGFFDGVHLGHQKIFDRAKELAVDCDFTVFTLKGDFDKNKNGNVYTFKEKCDIFYSLGAKHVLYAQATKEFFQTDCRDFFKLLTSRFNVKAIVVGSDYTFGKNALGNASVLREMCAENGIEFQEVELIKVGGRKISTAEVKNLLSSGKVDVAKSFLGTDFFICGQVVHGRGVGSKSIFPTANVNLPKDKVKLKYGVYATRTLVDGKWYNSLTNYGNSPTFNVKKPSAESFLLDYNGDLYGKKIKVCFLKYLREISKYENADQLKIQIQKDMEFFK